MLLVLYEQTLQVNNHCTLHDRVFMFVESLSRRARLQTQCWMKYQSSIMNCYVQLFLSNQRTMQFENIVHCEVVYLNLDPWNLFPAKRPVAMLYHIPSVIPHTQIHASYFATAALLEIHKSASFRRKKRKSSRDAKTKFQEKHTSKHSP